MQRQRRTAAASKGQTRAYSERLPELVSVLRSEVPTPPTPHGQPLVIVLMGQPGVGKSHCARLLCARLAAAHLSSDHLRSRLFIAASYAPDESATVFRAADALLDLLLSEGHRVVLDATNLLARNRAAVTETARRRGVPMIHVRIVAEQAQVLARLAERRRERRADDHSDADETIYRKMGTFEPPEGSHVELTNGPDLDAGIERVAKEVERCAAAS